MIESAHRENGGGLEKKNPKRLSWCVVLRRAQVKGQK